MLSTTTRMSGLCFFAMLVTVAMSTTLSRGFEGVSNHTICNQNKQFMAFRFFVICWLEIVDLSIYNRIICISSKIINKISADLILISYSFIVSDLIYHFHFLMPFQLESVDVFSFRLYSIDER